MAIASRQHCTNRAWSYIATVSTAGDRVYRVPCEGGNCTDIVCMQNLLMNMSKRNIIDILFPTQFNTPQIKPPNGGVCSRKSRNITVAFVHASA